MPILFLLSLVTFYSKNAYKETSFPLRKNFFLWILFGYCCYICISYWYHGFGSRELKAYIFSFIFLMFFPFERISHSLFIKFHIVNALWLTGVAVYQRFFEKIERVCGSINPISFGTLCALCFMILLIVTIESDTIKKRFFYLTLTILIAFTVYLTGTRGAVIAIFSVPIFLILCYRKLITIPLWAKIGLILLPIMAFIMAYPVISSRIKLGNTIEKENSIKSTSLRLQLWKASLSTFPKHPILGAGDGYLDDLKEMYSQSRISEELYREKMVLSHYHNQFIDKAVKNGLVGLTIFLSMLLYPFYLAVTIKGYWFYRLCIISIVGIIMVSGLTDVSLNHAPIIYYFLLNISWLMIALQKKDYENSYI